MITLKYLARHLNLSAATVSRALAGHRGVGAATTARVQALAAELGYQPNALGVGLRRGGSHTLGVVVPHLHNNFFPRLLQSIEETASHAGYSLLICQSGENAGRERQHLHTLLRAQVAGVLVSVARTTADFAPFEQVSRQVPLVFFDRFLEGSAVSAVVLDDRAGGYQATTHLLAQGYRRIAHLAGPQHLSIYRNRRLGYEQALREAGCPVVEELLLYSDLQLADGEQAAKQLLALPIPPDAVFSASDFAALGCLRTLQAQGTRVPADLGLVGFGDEFFCQYTTPALSSVDQRCALLGRAAVRQLLDLKASGPASQARHLLLQPALQVRASSQRQPNFIPAPITLSL